MRNKDVYHSVSYLILGLVILGAALVCLFADVPWIAAAMLGLIGLGMILVWANMWIVVVDDKTFISSDLLGRKRTLYFDDVCDYIYGYSSYGTGNWLVMKSGQILLGKHISPRFRLAVQARLTEKATAGDPAGDKKLTGLCWKKDNTKAQYAVTGILAALAAVMSVLMKSFVFALAMLPILLILVITACTADRRSATYELTEDGICTFSQNPFLQRSCTWAETTRIQIANTEIGAGRAMLHALYFVFVKGEENALIRCDAPETIRSLVADRNRIAIPLTYETKPIVLQLARQKGIPIECLPPAKELYETSI